MRIFYVIEAKEATPTLYLEEMKDKPLWTFDIYKAQQWTYKDDAEFDRLAFGLREAKVEEHIWQDKLVD